MLELRRIGDEVTGTELERQDVSAYLPAMAEPWGVPAAGAAPSKRAQRAADLEAWAGAAMAAHRVAEVLCRTPFVPVAYRDNAYAATAAILSGDELGLSPMMSLTAFHVIEGRAAPAAQTLRAVVQSRGHEIKVEESTDSRCVVAGRRRRPDGTFEEWQRSTWTTQRARTANLLGRKTWRENPTAMLLARASSECSRMVGADAILGIPYSAEELADSIAVDAAAAPALPERTAGRRTSPGRKGSPAPAPAAASAPQHDQPPLPTDEPAPAAAPAAAVDEPAGPPLPDDDEPGELVGEDPADEPLDPDAVAPPEDRQLRALGAILRKGEVTERAEALDICAHIIGHPVPSRNALTVGECRQILDVLRGWERQPNHADGFAGRMADELNTYALAQPDPEPGAEGMPDPTADDLAEGNPS